MGETGFHGSPSLWTSGNRVPPFPSVPDAFRKHEGNLKSWASPLEFSLVVP